MIQPMHQMHAQVQRLTPFWLWADGISETLLRLLEAELEGAQLEPGRLHGDQHDQNIRNSDVFGIPSFHWFSGVMFNYAAHANISAQWHRSISHPEVTQLAEYGPGGYYKWHDDTDPLAMLPTERKLTVVCLLSDPTEFEGGQLEIMGMDKPVPLKRGSVIVFPSMLAHRVTEVTNGTRRSLACWVRGPNSF